MLWRIRYVSLLTLLVAASGCQDQLVSPSMPLSAAKGGKPKPPCDGLPDGTSTLMIVPQSADVVVGETLQLSVTNGSGTEVPACALKWSSSNTAVATVSGEGFVVALAPGGPVTIKAQTSGKKPLQVAALVTVLPPDVVTGLRAYFPFSGNPLDVSGNNQHGTLGNAVSLTADRDGTPDAAYYFAGPYGNIESRIDIGQLDLIGAFTLSAWIRPDVQKVGAVISKFAWASVQGYELLYAGEQASNCIRLHTSGLRGSGGFDCTVPLELGRWYHVVGTYDGSSVGRLYLDGQMVAELSGLLPDFTGGPRTLLGQSAWGPQTFLGAIDEVRIYERALTPAQVTYLASLP